MFWAEAAVAKAQSDSEVFERSFIVCLGKKQG
jgi:hypothetical protein